MADKEKKPDAAAPEAAPAEAKAKKGLPIKVIAIVAVIMVLEAVAVVFVLGMLGGPKKSEAQVDPATLHHDESNEIQEIELVDDKWQNLTTGRVWIWDVAVVIQVKNKNVERVEKVLEQRGNQIREGVGQIVSKAQHAQLKEPERQSINRQIAAYLEKVVGTSDEGQSLVERVIIPKCRGFPADF